MDERVLKAKVDSAVEKISKDRGIPKEDIMKKIAQKIIENPGTMSLMDRARSGCSLSADILEDYYGIDIGQSGWEDVEEKVNMGIER